MTTDNANGNEVQTVNPSNRKHHGNENPLTKAGSSQGCSVALTSAHQPLATNLVCPLFIGHNDAGFNE
jgi:hypothetical protein